MYQIIYTLLNLHYFYIFRNYFVVVLSIPANLRLHSLVLIDQSSSVYASAIDSRKHFLFFREPVKNPGGLKTWLTFSLGICSKEMRDSFILYKVVRCLNWSKVCNRTGLQSPNLKSNLWIDEQIMAKEEVVVGEGVDMHTRTQVFKLWSRLPKTPGGFLLFIVLNSS